MLRISFSRIFCNTRNQDFNLDYTFQLFQMLLGNRKYLEEPEEQPEDAVNEFSPSYKHPKSENSIDIDRFLESKVQNKGEGDEIQSEEDIEPYRPYQANAEIQSLIERTKSKSEKQAQSTPVQIQPKFQVNIISY